VPQLIVRGCLYENIAAPPNVTAPTLNALQCSLYDELHPHTRVTARLGQIIHQGLRAHRRAPELAFQAALVNEPTGFQPPKRAFEFFEFRRRAVNFQPRQSGDRKHLFQQRTHASQMH
jgi:hypothetical protein